MTNNQSATASPHGRIGISDIERMERILQRLRAVDYRHGGGASRAAVLAVRSDVTLMPERASSDAVRLRAYQLLADLHNLLGWTSFDLGMVAEAKYHFAQAIELATVAGCADLVANVHYRTGRVHLHYRAPKEALSEFDAGREPAAGTPRTLGILSANQAWAYAKIGHRDEALRLLDQAQEEFAASDPADVPSWSSFFDANDVTAMIGTVHTELAMTSGPEHTETAIPAVTAAIAGYGDEMARSRAFNLAALAIDHEIAGDLDASHTAGMQAIELSTQVRSQRMRDRLRPLLERSARHKHNPYAQELARRLSELLRQPVPNGS